MNNHNDAKFRTYIYHVLLASFLRWDVLTGAISFNTIPQTQRATAGRWQWPLILVILLESKGRLKRS